MNEEEIVSLIGTRGEVRRHTIEFYAEGRRVASQRAADVFSSAAELISYTDIVVDVSGMPRGVFFPLIARMLYFIDRGRMATGKDVPNMFVLVAEDPGLDTAISQEGVEELADFIATFRGAFDQESRADLPTVWIPLLGEGRSVQIPRIYDLVKPDEICPVLPSPARNPRRADNIVREYHDLLFSQLIVDPENLIFAAEQNPFEVYRTL